MQYCATLINEARYDVAVKTIVKYGSPSNSSNFDTYTRIIREVIHDSSKENIALLREMCFKLVHGTNFMVLPNIPQTFQDYLTISHLISLRNNCAKKPELSYFAAKQSISLLRYTRDIHLSQTFYDAGLFAKVISNNLVGWNG